MLPLKPIGLSLVLLATASTDSTNHPPTSSPGVPCVTTQHPQFVPLPTEVGTLKRIRSFGYDRITPVFCPIQTEDLGEFTKQFSAGTAEAERWCGQSATLIPPTRVSYFICQPSQKVCFTVSLRWS
jgi:hypothetical protein